MLQQRYDGEKVKTDLGQTREEPRFLVRIRPLEVEQELNRAPERIEQVRDTRAVSLRTLRLELSFATSINLRSDQGMTKAKTSAPCLRRQCSFASPHQTLHAACALSQAHRR